MADGDDKGAAVRRTSASKSEVNSPTSADLSSMPSRLPSPDPVSGVESLISTHPRRRIPAIFAAALVLAALAACTASLAFGDKSVSDGDPRNVIVMEAPAAQAAQSQWDGAEPVVPADVEGSGFAASDAYQVWSQQTTIDLFSNSYVNDAGQTTVASADGDKLIAPGTSGAYTFALRNTGTVLLDCRVWIETEQGGSSAPIPVSLALAAGSDRTPSTEALTQDSCDGLSEAVCLPARATALYTLSWIWPFNADDDADTVLGDEASLRDVSYTVTIHTQASADVSADNGSSSRPNGTHPTSAVPRTADFTPNAAPLAFAGLAFIGMAALMLWVYARKTHMRAVDARADVVPRICAHHIGADAADTSGKIARNRCRRSEDDPDGGLH